MSLRSLASLLALSALATAPAGDGSDAWTLFQSLYGGTRVEIRAPAGVLEQEARRALVRLEQSTRFRGVVRRFGEPGNGGARVLLGTLAEEEVRALAAHVGVESLERVGFSVLGRAYREPGDALVATFEDPERPGLPVSLFLGNDARLLGLYVTDVTPAWEPRLRTWASGDLDLDCTLAASGAPSTESAPLVDYGARRAEREAEARRLPWAGFVVHVTDPVEPGLRRTGRVRPYLQAIERARERVGEWLGGEPPGEMTIWVYGHPEDLVRVTARTELSVVNPIQGAVHALFAPGLPDDGGAGVARATAVAIAGDPAAPWLLDGVATAAAGSWWGRDLEDWVGFLHAGGLGLSVRELASPSAERRIDPHRLLPLRGFLVRHLLETRGVDSLRALWAGRSALDALAAPGEPGEPGENGALEASFRAALARGSERRLRRDGEADRRAEALAVPFRGGVVVLEAGQDPDRGYLSRQVDRSLSDAAAHGVDAALFSAIAYARSRPPRLAGETRAPIDGASSDLALAAGMAAARRAGMRVALALEPLATPSGTWADAMALLSEAQCREFFDDYERLAIHYGLLAELTGCELFSLGAELRVATRELLRSSAESIDLGPLRLELWRRLIARVRGAFTGALTYAADVEWEAQAVAFWDDLDFVGLTLFARLPDFPAPPSDADVTRTLEYGLAAAAELARRWERPALVLQTGFPSTAGSLAHADVPRGPPDAEAQARGYASLAAALDRAELAGRELRGVFLWSWSTDPRAGGRAGEGYTPQGKPALELLPRVLER